MTDSLEPATTPATESQPKHSGCAEVGSSSTGFNQHVANLNVSRKQVIAIALVSTKTTTFTTLPIEVKEKVYEQLLLKAKLFATPRPRLPGLCLTNKTEYSIAAGVLLRRAGICLVSDRDAESWQRWIATIDEFHAHGLPGYTKVEVRYGSQRRKGDFAQDFQFLSSFTFLREVTITIYHGWEDLMLEHIRQFRGGNTDPRRIWSETHEFINKTQILRLRACPSLNRVYLQGIYSRWALKCPQEVAMFADKIAVRIKRDYIRTHGRILQVVLVCKDEHRVRLEVPIGQILGKWAARLAKP